MVKVIKMYGWEHAFAEHNAGAREREMGVIRKVRTSLGTDTEIIGRIQRTNTLWLWGIHSVVIFCRCIFRDISTSCWADTVATVQPNW